MKSAFEPPSLKGRTPLLSKLVSEPLAFLREESLLPCFKYGERELLPRYRLGCAERYCKEVFETAGDLVFSFTTEYGDVTSSVVTLVIVMAMLGG